MDVSAVLGDPPFVLSAVAVVLSIVLCWLSYRRPQALPPSPGRALPLLGHLHLLKRDPRPQFLEWRRQYGDVFSLYVGSNLVVVLNGFGIIKEALVKKADVFTDRPVVPLFEHMQLGRGITSESGPLWKTTRTASLQILRELGMGRNVLAHKLQEEITEYLGALGDKEGQPFNLTLLTQTSISNNICSIVFGKRFDYKDADFQEYMTALQTVFQGLSTGGVTTFFPALRYLPSDPFKVNQTIQAIRTIVNKFVEPVVERHVKEYSEDSVDNYISRYIQQTKRQPTGLLATAESKHFKRVVADLFSAGTETTSTGICWAIAYFLHYPHIQDKCYQELLRVVGTGRLPGILDRQEMTYLQAFIMEVLRMASFVPLSIAHSTACDVSLAGYTIPKGVTVVPNLDSVLHDPGVWGDPENFRPERFIGPEGKISKPEEFIPFSIGRRVCLGESLAKMELFLYLASMIQRFTFLPPEDGQLPSLTDSILGPVSQPLPFKVRAVPRG